MTEYDEMVCKDGRFTPFDWLSQAVVDWAGEEGTLVEFEYSNRRASIVGETLVAGGSVQAIEGNEVTLDLFLRNEAGDITTPGRATVRFAD